MDKSRHEPEENLEDEHSDQNAEKVETVKERVRKLEENIKAKSSQFSLLYQREKNQANKANNNPDEKSTNTSVDELTNTGVVKSKETPAQKKTDKLSSIPAEKGTEALTKERTESDQNQMDKATNNQVDESTKIPAEKKKEIPDEKSMRTTSQENTRTTDLQRTKPQDVKSTEKRNIKSKTTEADTLPDTSCEYPDLSNNYIQRYQYLDSKDRAQVQMGRQFHGDICTVPELSLSYDPDREGHEEIRIVLLGKTGTGKSATGNTILGKMLFESSASGSSITSRCSQRSSIRFGWKIVIVDTPGIFDTAHTNEHTQTEICKCIAITSPGPHAFILVLNVSRFTQEEQNTIDHFIKHFGENIYKYAIILFTRKDDLDEEGKNIFDHLKTSPAQLQMLVKKCGGRVIAFNNRLKEDKQDAQAKQLIDEILKNVKQNGGKCYTNEMFEEAEKILKKREEEIARKAKEEHDKELRAIEEAIAKKYETKYKEDHQKLKHLERRVLELTYTHEQAERQVKELQDKLEENKKQLKKSKGTEKEYFQSNVERLQRDLEHTKANKKSKALEIQKLKKSRETAERQQREMERKQDEEKKKIKRELQEKYDRKIVTVRDEVRKEVEEGGNFITRAFSWIKKKLKFW